MQKALLFLPFLFSVTLQAQTNISVTTTVGTNILNGTYNPASFAATTVISDHAKIACLLDDELSSDSLLGYLEVLGTFHTRHTYSDTTSPDSGIGAAQRWVHSKLQAFSARNDNRLQPAYLKFDQPANTCGPANGLKNVLGILPGTDPNSALVIVEAHMDTRCEERCNDSCFAPGIDDNGSGTALVMELARVMSRFTFEHTLVFMLTTGEEQGLLGATAMAEYCSLNNIPVKGVQNNDVVGGIVCGQTASSPGCDPPFSIDSTRVRLYASPSFLQPHQGFARTVKMYYDEKMKPQARVPMNVEIINQEDRVGRGGDHIPFRQRGFTNMRFSSAHEHGDAGVTDPNYNDHQHTGRDVLGEDLDNDGKLDTFYVNVNYLRRNTLINGVSLTMLALGPEVPPWNLVNDPSGMVVQIVNGTHAEYRVGVRSGLGSPEFDALYRFNGSSFSIPGIQNGTFYYVSVAAIDSAKIMSPFSEEERVQAAATSAPGTQDSLPYSLNCFLFSVDESPILKYRSGFHLLPVKPNPLEGRAIFTIVADGVKSHASAAILVTDNLGREVARLPLDLKRGENYLEYHHKGAGGLHFCRLEVDGQVVDSGKMVVR